jgi:hypothetical protein
MAPLLLPLLFSPYLKGSWLNDSRPPCYDHSSLVDSRFAGPPRAKMVVVAHIPKGTDAGS